MALARGYDVSDYQSSVPKDAEFAVIKASEGQRTVQSGYRAKVATARARGIPLGHYHFMHAENPVAAEVDHFCDVVGDVPEGEFLVLDFEPYGQGQSDAACTRWKNTWLAAVKQRYPNRLVGMYANLDWWHRTDDNCGDFLWIADYDRAAGSPAVQAPWRFHQHSESGGLDRNVFNGSVADLRAWLGGGAAPRPPASGPRSWERLVARVEAIAEGVYEGYNSRTGYDNNTSWGRQFGENYVPWCVIFDWCMYNDVDLEGIVPKVDNVDAVTAWAKARGQWSEYPSVGAWTNFGNGAHTELVMRFDDTYVWTKGGNTLPAGGDGGQGKGVYSHRNLRRDPRITGYFAPSFPDGCPPTADPHDYRAGRMAPPVLEDDVTVDELLNTVLATKIGDQTHSAKVSEWILMGGINTQKGEEIEEKLDALAARIAAPVPVQVDAAALVAAMSDPSVLTALAQALAGEVAKRMES
jgi:hypothetical protein